MTLLQDPLFWNLVSWRFRELSWLQLRWTSRYLLKLGWSVQVGRFHTAGGDLRASAALVFGPFSKLATNGGDR